MAHGAEQMQRTPFHDRHVALGAKMVPFAGFEMPIQYPTGITAEHKAVRERCGLFDVSHMGEFIVRGPAAGDFLNYVTTNDVAALEVGQAHYSTMLNERGTVEDDCLVYRFADRYMVVVNASNRPKDYAHIDRERHRFDCSLEDVSDETALLALQGPEAQRILQPLVDVELESIGYYRFVEGRVADAPAVVSRTGYTGEDGFELYFGAADAGRVWDALMATGEVTPAGLGARDSLRLEMGMALYGNDIDDTTTPYEANLGWLVKLKKGDFVGRDALVRQKEAGVPRKLVGFALEERAFPRPGFPVFQDGVASGLTRSGTVSPSLGTPIGTCYLPTAGAEPGRRLEVEIRGRRVPGRVVKMPFYAGASHR
ncbi:MAG TPA: glycine cleavage system aminomethyltransferase GcvT [Gemmatimonadaceae bacterium]|nr:glycine cleavage system aminomethyltransferase GcvT [Gemmatimonadaceae bacterium]